MNPMLEQKSRIARIVASFWKATVSLLALIGLIWLVGGPLFRLIFSPMFVREVVHKSPSPDGRAVAEIEVTTGGLGTVWTTRVHLRMVGNEPWTVYQTKDSEFSPPLRWLDSRTLLIGLPCGRFDHASNPDDWESAYAPRPDRLKVRFTHPANCN